jgi:polyisoprenoid-binding protein YceI
MPASSRAIRLEKGLLMIRMLAIFAWVFVSMVAGVGTGARATVGDSRASAPADTRTIDKPGSKIEFHAKATFTKIIGVFHGWDADLKTPSDTFADASLNLKLESDSVSTGSGIKDKEIKNKNFFDIKQFPEIVFVSTKVTPGSDPGKFVMDGNMTMRGITKPVTVTIVEHPVVNGHQMIDGEIAFNRRNFGMTHNVPFNKVANEVEVEIHLNIVSGGAAVAAK